MSRVHTVALAAAESARLSQARRAHGDVAVARQAGVSLPTLHKAAAGSPVLPAIAFALVGAANDLASTPATAAGAADRTARTARSTTR